jgi:hypothetical protein
MIAETEDANVRAPSCDTRIHGAALALVGALAMAAGPALGHGRDDHDGERGRGACAQTAQLALQACWAEVWDDTLIAKANCLNASDTDERRACKEEARDERAESVGLCRDQYEARLDVCELVGKGRYDPDFDPENFSEDAFGNRYFPLAVGNEWRYESTYEDEDEGEEVTETTTVRVVENEDEPGMPATKNIEGVTCVVVNDVVDVDGETMEDTDDWFATHLYTGDVWYCGEISKELETFEGDNPEVPELVDLEGSWKTGRDEALPGILVKADPMVGDADRQEYLLGVAEDVAEVLSTTYVYGGETDDPESLDYLVPQELAERFCTVALPCMVRRELTALEPDVEERKYYGQDVGVFLEVDLTEEVITELVECSGPPGC